MIAGNMIGNDFVTNVADAVRPLAGGVAAVTNRGQTL
jgi:hypothetical protein